MSGAPQLTDREKKKRDEQNAKIFSELLGLPENQACADCGERGPRWASSNLGCFLCIRCGGLHRKLGTHISKIKSITLDSWTPEQMDFMRQWGNKRANERFLAAGAPRAPSTSDYDMEQYIRNKYDKKLYENPGGGNRATDVARGREANPFESQLRQLTSMGFNDEAANLVALRRSNGNLDTAIELITAMQQKGIGGSQTQGGSRAQESRNNTAAGTSRQNAQVSNTQAATPALQSALQILQSMGFSNQEENLQALRAANGQPEAAANMLLDRNRRQSFNQQTAPAVPARNVSSTPFVLNPPATQAGGGRAGRQQGQPHGQQQSKPQENDFFGGFVENNQAPPQQHAQQQQQQQQQQQSQAFPTASSELASLFSSPVQQPQVAQQNYSQSLQPEQQQVSQPARPAKESIMSLFNTPGPQYGNPGGNVGMYGGGFPQQQPQYMGFNQQQQPFQQLGGFPQSAHRPGQQFAAPNNMGISSNPFAYQPQQQQQQLHGQVQMPMQPFQQGQQFSGGFAQQSQLGAAGQRAYGYGAATNNPVQGNSAPFGSTPRALDTPSGGDQAGPNQQLFSDLGSFQRPAAAGPSNPAGFF
ncbi:putative GTPase activating protein for Arf-domain-containing protein [Phlyctochytrium arcticum]|nr:putative GTPase activating protein for Arf-domain-containing protein [Phlyctochytrium arcticum]